MAPSAETSSVIDSNAVQMKRELGLLEGVSIIVGIIIGSGIFISPTSVLNEAGSVGFSLIIWVFCGLLSMIGAICYAELGTCIPKSGGDYVYIKECFGPLLSFLYLWDAMLIFVPTGNAIMGLTFANYIVQPFFPTCVMPDTATRLLAAVVISLLTFVNCWNVKLTTKTQTVFMFAKVGALLVIIGTGIAHLYLSEASHFKNIFQGTTKNPGKVAIAFYSGIFCYAGWNYLNFMTEELKDPYKNLPRAIYISLPVVTVIYFLANISYVAVLTPIQMMESKAIAVTYGNEILEIFSCLMPVTVALTALGGLSVHIMTSSRLCFVGARNGHFPSMLALLSINRYTPIPSLIFLNILSMIMLCTSDIYLLITYASFVESIFIMLSVSGVLLLRWRTPDMERPIKVPIIVPIVFIMISIFLVILPCYVRPFEVGMGILITLTGIPAYYFGLIWEEKPLWVTITLGKSTCIIQKLFISAPEEKLEIEVSNTAENDVPRF